MSMFDCEVTGCKESGAEVTLCHGAVPARLCNEHRRQFDRDMLGYDGFAEWQEACDEVAMRLSPSNGPFDSADTRVAMERKRDLHTTIFTWSSAWLERMMAPVEENKEGTDAEVPADVGTE